MAPAKKKEKASIPESQPPPEPNYPAIEGFIETATAEDIQATFKGLGDELADLKGPRAQQGKKIAKAIERTEELLNYLLQVREKIKNERQEASQRPK